ncbi:MAG TPA: family 20 glycosylhydrolase [Flavobacteriales bacterium]|nr:family 20 glycosylhydrolase [Flavobacteriales bacterium]HMR28451.1 family 20 glycosylhydrolase [Flavobacteriales bacterium]
MRVRTLLPVVLLLAGTPVRAQQAPDLIPAPVDLQLDGGSLDLRCPWVVNADAPLRAVVEAELLALHPASELACFAPTPITFQRVAFDTLMPPEWHLVQVAGGGITVTAPSEEGLYRGSRTLIQLLEQGRETGTLPSLTVTDHPRFPWRGMHLDPCRHFWSVDFTKTYIDLLARYKMNRFHWHLTDDQGWRIEIKKYPKLTGVGAWRNGSQVGPYSRREHDSIPYGGFYTQEQIREVVAYAAARHITVVPEIEMPGHAMAALAAYPRLGCTGGPYEVQKGWGVFEDVFCAGNDSVFTVLEDVLTEVMDLFPSATIHIGGDECPKERWKACTKCRSRMKAEGLKDEHELQSYFIQRIERFVNAKGRTIIGWDEILEGGLAPNAAVMSWRGTEGGMAAARSGHYAVMSPGSHCYFDHYQGDPANEPLAIGGYTPLQKVYSYEPIPAELKPEEAKYILGAQGNVWTEYILTPEHVEYMAVPRMLALAEVLWTPKEKRDEGDFIRRLENEFPKLEAMTVNVSKSLYQVSIRPKQGPKPGSIAVGMTLATGGSFSMTELRPPYDETTAQLGIYTGPVIIDSDRELHGWLQREGLTGPISKRRFLFNKATARPITLSVPPHERYNEGGAFTLVDGITAQEKRVNTEWLGWREGVTITVDLGSEQDVREVGIGALNETHSWIHLPERVDFSVSTDGKTYLQVGSAEVKAGVGRNLFSLGKVGKARYVRFTVKHRGKIPEGFPGAGNPAWMFLDEIEVR